MKRAYIEDRFGNCICELEPYLDDDGELLGWSTPSEYFMPCVVDEGDTFTVIVKEVAT